MNDTEDNDFIFMASSSSNINECNMLKTLSKQLKQPIHLKFDYVYNEPFFNVSDAVQKITFGGMFNQPVGCKNCCNKTCPKNLPNDLTHLTFEYNFNQKVDNLPKNLTHLTFDYNFNQKVDNLPKTLIYLKFGTKFNQHIDNLCNSIDGKLS